MKIWKGEIGAKMNKKTSINFMSLNLSPLTASELQNLAVIQQCIYQTTYRNVGEFKKWRLGPHRRWKIYLLWCLTAELIIRIELMSVVSYCATIFSTNLNTFGWINVSSILTRSQDTILPYENVSQAPLWLSLGLKLFSIILSLCTIQGGPKNGTSYCAPHNFTSC